MRVHLLIVCVCTYVLRCDSSGSYNSFYNEVVNKNEQLKSAISNDLPKEGKFFDAMSECKCFDDAVFFLANHSNELDDLTLTMRCF